MKDVVRSIHGLPQGIQASHVTDIKFEPWIAVPASHIVLLLLIAGKDPDLADVGLKESIQHGVTEAASAARNQKCPSRENVVHRNPNGKPRTSHPGPSRRVKADLLKRNTTEAELIIRRAEGPETSQG
jgi:hypothetical protein